MTNIYSLRDGYCRDGHASTPPARLCAFSMLETSVGIFILSACLVAFVQMRTMTLGERLRLHTVEQARVQLVNVLELLGDVPQKEFIAGTFPRKEVDTLVGNSFPDGQLKFEVVKIVFEPEEKQPGTTLNTAAKKESDKPPKKAVQPEVTVHALRATLTWYDGPSKPRKSVTLTKILPDSIAPQK